MKVIGVTGKAGSGKDTVANHLIAKYGYRREQFAYDLKRIVCETFDWDRDRMDELEYKEEKPVNPDGTFQCPGPDGEGLTRRDVLIELGTNCLRDKVDQDIHVKLTARRVEPVLRAFRGQRAARIIFADVRFLNEAAAIRSWGGEIWRTVKIGGSGTSGASAAHKSETEMDLITADCILEAAHGQVDLLLRQADLLLPKF